MTFKLLLILHLLGATIWVGGHIVLLAAILPRALAEHDAAAIKRFEQGFGPIGLPALIVQLLTGLWLASLRVGGLGELLDPTTASERMVLLKLVLLVSIVLMAGHAHRRILPRLTGDAMGTFALHACIVTGISIALLVLGVGVRFGGL